jgi:RNA polymerase sigma factor (sigma-70 family)
MARWSRTSCNAYPGLDAYALRVIRCRAAQLAGRGGFADQEREDLEQEFAADLLPRLSEFDRARGAFSTFVRHVVENRVAALLRHRSAAKRAQGRNGVSLHDEVDDGDGHRVQRWRTLATEDLYRRTGAADDDAPEACDLRLDVRAALETIPPAQREFCDWLESHSVSEAARASRIPRSTVHDRLADIRARFREAGLDAPARRRPANSRERE